MNPPLQAMDCEGERHRTSCRSHTAIVRIPRGCRVMLNCRQSCGRRFSDQRGRSVPRWWHEISEPVEDLKRRAFDDTAGSRPRGLPSAARAYPVGGFVSRQHVADASAAAVCTTPYGESFEREGGPGALPQQMFETPKITGRVAVEERDPDTGMAFESFARRKCRAIRRPAGTDQTKWTNRLSALGLMELPRPTV